MNLSSRLRNWLTVVAQASFAKNRIGGRKVMAIATVVVCAGLLWWKLAPEPSLRKVADLTTDAVLRGDGDAILRFADPHEIAALNLTPAKMIHITERLKARRESLKAVATPRTYSEDGRVGVVQADQKLSTADGRLLELMITVARTDDGPRVQSLLYSLVVYEASENLKSDDASRRGAAKLIALRDALPTISNRYTSDGLNGIYLSDAPGHRSFSWADLANQWEARIARATAHPRN